MLEAERLMPFPKCNGTRRTLLDLGCGTGYASLLWRDYYGGSARVIAADSEPLQLRRAERLAWCDRGPQPARMAVDAGHLPFAATGSRGAPRLERGGRPSRPSCLPCLLFGQSSPD